MEEKAKQRLVGILVFVGALFVILPFLFHNSRPSAAQKPMANAAAAAPTVSVALPPAQPVPAPAMASAQSTDTSASAAALASPSTPAPASVQASQTPAPQTPASTPVTAAATAPTAMPTNTATTTAVAPATPAPVQPTEVAANTPEPGITPTGLTAGEPDDQPTAIQKASADALPAAPAVKSLTTAASTVEPTPVASTPTVASEEKVAKKTAQKKHALAAEKKHEWIVQVGVFSEEKNAQHLLATLRQHHFPAYAHAVVREGRALHVVYVGPEMNLSKAKMAQRELSQTVRLHGEIKHFQA